MSASGEMNSASTATCPDCSASATEIVRISNFKHVWLMCRICGNMRRTKKIVYPTDGFFRLLSKFPFAKKVWFRLFPGTQRFLRINNEEKAYANYGLTYDHVMNTPPGHFFETEFGKFFKNRYLKEHELTMAQLAPHGVIFEGKSVLDVSGGPGIFGKLIKPFVGRVAVTEYDPNTVSQMQERLGDVRVFKANLNEPWTDKDVFDIVLYRSCVYFCFDLDAHISQIKDRVADKGIIYIRTSMPTLGNTLRWQYQEYTQNVYYHPQTLQNILHKHSFEVFASGVDEDYDHFLKFYSFWERIYHLYGYWNVWRPNGPRGVDARQAWVLARKRT